MPKSNGDSPDLRFRVHTGLTPVVWPLIAPRPELEFLGGGPPKLVIHSKIGRRLAGLPRAKVR
jgi:hypothetical protein